MVFCTVTYDHLFMLASPIFMVKFGTQTKALSLVPEIVVAAGAVSGVAEAEAFSAVAEAAAALPLVATLVCKVDDTLRTP